MKSKEQTFTKEITDFEIGPEAERMDKLGNASGLFGVEYHYAQ